METYDVALYFLWNFSSVFKLQSPTGDGGLLSAIQAELDKRREYIATDSDEGESVSYYVLLSKLFYNLKWSGSSTVIPRVCGVHTIPCPNQTNLKEYSKKSNIRITLLFGYSNILSLKN